MLRPSPSRGRISFSSDPDSPSAARERIFEELRDGGATFFRLTAKNNSESSEDPATSSLSSTPKKPSRQALAKAAKKELHDTWKGKHRQMMENSFSPEVEIPAAARKKPPAHVRVCDRVDRGVLGREQAYPHHGYTGFGPVSDQFQTGLFRPVPCPRMPDLRIEVHVTSPPPCRPVHVLSDFRRVNMSDHAQNQKCPVGRSAECHLQSGPILVRRRSVEPVRFLPRCPPRGSRSVGFFADYSRHRPPLVPPGRREARGGDVVCYSGQH